MDAWDLATYTPKRAQLENKSQSFNQTLIKIWLSSLSNVVGQDHALLLLFDHWTVLLPCGMEGNALSCRFFTPCNLSAFTKFFGGYQGRIHFLLCFGLASITPCNMTGAEWRDNHLPYPSLIPCTSPGPLLYPKGWWGIYLPTIVNCPITLPLFCSYPTRPPWHLEMACGMLGWLSDFLCFFTPQGYLVLWFSFVEWWGETESLSPLSCAIVALSPFSCGQTASHISSRYRLSTRPKKHSPT